MTENLQPKGGGGDQPLLEHRVFLHFFITLEKANVPKVYFQPYVVGTEGKSGQQEKLDSLWKTFV